MSGLLAELIVSISLLFTLVDSGTFSPRFTTNSRDNVGTILLLGTASFMATIRVGRNDFTTYTSVGRAKDPSWESKGVVVSGPYGDHRASLHYPMGVVLFSVPDSFTFYGANPSSTLSPTGDGYRLKTTLDVSTGVSIGGA